MSVIIWMMIGVGIGYSVAYYLSRKFPRKIDTDIAIKYLNGKGYSVQINVNHKKEKRVFADGSQRIIQ